MIGIDTNVLLRHTLRDDPIQSPSASAFLLDPQRRIEPALINPVLLVELVWTLRRKGYGKADVLTLPDVLAASPDIVFVDDAATRRAIDDWRKGKADFPDYPIGHLNRAAGAATTMTFDRDAGAELIFSLLTT